MFPVKVETRILLNCPHCKFSSRYDTGFLEDAIHDGKEISCVACGCHFKLSVVAVYAPQHNAHLTPESLASSQAVVNASALEQSDSVPPPAQAQVA